MATIYISETDAASNFASLISHVREGSEVIIESGSHPIAVIRYPQLPRRSLSESIALGDISSGTCCFKSALDEDFANDMEEIIRNRKPANRSAWDE